MLALACVSTLGIKSWQLDHLDLDEANSEGFPVKVVCRLATIGLYLEIVVQ